MTNRAERAKLYYVLAAREAILQFDDDFCNCAEIHQTILVEHPELAKHASLREKSELLFRICLEEFIEAGWLDSIRDEFAPLFIRSNASMTEGPMSNRDFKQLYDKYEKLGDAQTDWLDSALIAAVESFKMVELEAILRERNQEKEPDLVEAIGGSKTPDDYWSPIPLERSDSNQADALRAVEKTIEELRGDNGYAATYPEEKAFVQDKLSAVARRLRDDSQISWMYLSEFAFKPLAILIKRFGQAAVGVTASLARETLLSWLKSKGLGFLDEFLK